MTLRHILHEIGVVKYLAFLLAVVVACSAISGGLIFMRMGKGNPYRDGLKATGTLSIVALRDTPLGQGNLFGEEDNLWYSYIVTEGDHKLVKKGQLTNGAWVYDTLSPGEQPYLEFREAVWTKPRLEFDIFWWPRPTPAPTAIYIPTGSVVSDYLIDLQ